MQFLLFLRSDCADCTCAFSGKYEYGPEIGRFTSNYKTNQCVDFFTLRYGVLKIWNSGLFLFALDFNL